MIFTETRERLSGERRDYACLLLERRSDRLVLRHDGALGEAPERVDLPAGSLCLAYYWPHHPYIVYHWMDGEGRTLGFSINLSGPVLIDEDHVDWNDLVVRVHLLPDETLGYQVEVIGEDQVPQEIDASTRRHLDSALNEVMQEWPALVRAVSEHSTRLRRREPGSSGGRNPD